MHILPRRSALKIHPPLQNRLPRQHVHESRGPRRRRHPQLPRTRLSWIHRLPRIHGDARPEGNPSTSGAVAPRPPSEAKDPLRLPYARHRPPRRSGRRDPHHESDTG